MEIKFECPDKVNGMMTITVEETDYKDKVEKKLKEYRRRANVPGFRPGQAPMGMIRRQYGASLKMDEINQLIGSEIYKYVDDNKIEMLGQPLPNEAQEAQDLEKPGPYVFKFDIAVAPEINVELSARNKIDYYDIKVDDKLIEQQISAYASRFGHHDTTVTDYQDNDLLKGDLRELDEKGNTKEGGITVEGAIIMPSYIKVEEQKALFDKAKLGDIITFNPRKAYPNGDFELSSLLKIEDKEQAKNVTSDFSYQITEIDRYVNAEVNQELFDNVYGKDAVSSEKEFRARIKEEIEGQMVVNSDFKFQEDLKAYCIDKCGKLVYPEELLKRIMLANNKDKDAEFVEKNFKASLDALTWDLIKGKLCRAHEIKVEEDDIKGVALQQTRMQFAQYGVSNLPDEYFESYVAEELKKRENLDHYISIATDRKLVEKMKTVVKLNKKEVSFDEFNKMLGE